MQYSTSLYHQLIASLGSIFIDLPASQVLFYDDEAQCLKWLALNHGEIHEQVIEDYQKVVFQKFRSQAQGYQWLAKEELPWEEGKNEKQFALDDEISKNILMLSCP